MDSDTLPGQDKRRGLCTMILIAALVGVIAGFGAVIFRYLIGVIHNLSFLGTLDPNYNANEHTILGPYGMWIIFVPVIGAVFVSYLVKNFAPEAKGHGVPEVVEAIYFKDGKIKPMVALVKSLASAISIGTGGSVGREGPIVQIGSTFGSVMGCMISMPVRQRIILVAAGASAGIAATFNTPVGALAFGIELMLVSASAYSMFLVSISVAIATYIGRVFLGIIPSFYLPKLSVPDFHMMNGGEILVFLVFGLVIGLISIVFIRSIYWSEDMFAKVPGNYYTRHTLGMLCMGILLYIMINKTGHYYVQGVGYATVVDILTGILTDPKLLLLLILLKLLATCLTLGSGGSGGIFSPALFIGAATGGLFGVLVSHVVPVDPVVLALAGMAGMISGSTGAVMTAMVMIVEMTHDMDASLPTLITVATSYYVRKKLSNDSVYTLKLTRRHEVAPEGLQVNLASVTHAYHVMNKKFKIINKDSLDNAKDSDSVLIIKNNNDVTGIYQANKNNNYINNSFIKLHENTLMSEIICKMNQQNVDYSVIHDDHDIVGIIGKDEIIKTIAKTDSLLD